MSYEEDLERRNAELEKELDEAIKLIEILIPVHVEAETFLFDCGYYEALDTIDNDGNHKADFGVDLDDLDDLSDSISDNPKLLEYITEYLERINNDED